MLKNVLSDGIQSTPAFFEQIIKSSQGPNRISFAGGMPNPNSFPQEELLESMKRVVETYGSKVFQYSITTGLPELRKYIADRYNKMCGLNLTWENVVITTGSQQALDILSKLFLNMGDTLAVEKPTYLSAIQAFSMRTPKFVEITLNEDGLDIEQLKEVLEQNPKMLYLIPNFHNPTGVCYTKENREQIRELLRGRDTILLEDDAYGELRYEGEAMPYIGFGHLKNSVLLGSFSKTISPGMRIGYIIAEDEEMLHYLGVAKEGCDLHTNVFAQYMLWDYLTNNGYDNHIAKVRKIYHVQAKTMLAAMDKYFPPEVKFTRSRGGMFTWATLPEGIMGMDVFHRALELDVAIVPGDPFYVGAQPSNTIRINYSNASSEMIDIGIHRLGDLLKEMIAEQKAK